MSSVFSRNQNLAIAISRGSTGAEVIKELIPEGSAHLYEKSLWDYKRELPVLKPIPQPSETEKAIYAIKMAHLVKDVVAFYNSCGGYVVAGIDDSTKNLIGFQEIFDCGDLNKKVLSATRRSIDCHFVFHQVQGAVDNVTVGLLFIPKRPDSEDPVVFLRDSPKDTSGKFLYQKGQIYLRDADQCRPALGIEDYSFLCAQGRRSLLEQPTVLPRALSNNLGLRDPGFISFVGRDEQLGSLWRWLCDPFAPAKLIAGVGGVGKTTLAREFAEGVIRTPPQGLEAVIWLSAKQRFYTALTGEYEPTYQVDFNDVETFLKKLHKELGCSNGEMDPDISTQELIEDIIAALKILPSLLIVDDLDSLSVAHQHELFQVIVQIISRTYGITSSTASRAILTSRIDLGASPAQLISVDGLKYEEFVEYVALQADMLGIKWKADNATMRSFHKGTGGSPTFASSVLRVLNCGESLSWAMKEWKGKDGEEARVFAFGKELECLSSSQIRTLYAVVLLSETSFIELRSVLQSSEALLKDDLAELRKYHLIAQQTEMPGGARLGVSSAITLMQDILKKRVHNPTWLERECKKVRAGVDQKTSEVGKLTFRAVALWRAAHNEEALQMIRKSLKDKFLRDDADLHCLLGRALLRGDPPDAREADLAFKKAQELGCTRPELPTFWLDARAHLKDWMGVIELCGRIPPDANTVLAQGEAYRALADIALETNNYQRACEHSIAGLRAIQNAFKKAFGVGRETELRLLSMELADRYIRSVDRTYTFELDKLNVWEAVADVMFCNVFSSEVAERGFKALMKWLAACRAPDGGSLDHVARQISAIRTMAGKDRSAGSDLQEVLNRCAVLIEKAKFRMA